MISLMKNNKILSLLLIFATLSGCAAQPTSIKHKPDNQKVVRAAVIGGMVYSGLWPEIVRRFEARTGYQVKTVKFGIRPQLATSLRMGQVDLLTMHSGDITTDLVADGYGINMRPWTRNDLVIWGPKSDPAHIRGLTSGIEAVKRIAATSSNWIDFRGIGPRELGHSLWHQAGIKPQGAWVLQDDLPGGRQLMTQVAAKNAYIITGRMPVLLGKWHADPQMEMLVDSDPTMRRPYIVMEANPARHSDVNSAGAKALADFLLSDEVQQFLLTFDGPVNDGVPLFYPVWPTLAR